jgi:hypothetical protein
MRCVGAIQAAGRFAAAGSLSERDRFLSRSQSHAELERRMQQWSEFEQRPWLPPR